MRLIGLAVVATLSVILAPLATEGQQSGKVFRVGILAIPPREHSAPIIKPLVEALHDLGYVDGRTIAFEYRHAGGRIERLADLAAELVGSRVDVIVTGTNLVTAAARQATTTIPIVMVLANDPVSQGFIASFVRAPDDIERAVAAMKRERAGAFLVLPDPVTYSVRKQSADLATKNHLAAASLTREYAEAGYLMTYGPSIPDLYRRSAIYVDKILKGAKPGDLPIEQPAKFELVINLKTAKALGLTIPQTLLQRADQVIQ